MARADDAKPPNTPAQRRVVRALASALRHRCGVGEGDALLVACSGGADSVALLRALHALASRRRWRLTLTVAHVQHHLRDTAERDAAYVEKLAETLRLGFCRADVHLGNEADANARTHPDCSNLENRARRARYAALQKMAEETNTRFVVTGHHADDQLETVLMRLMRGSALHGLRGIAWRRSLLPPTAANTAASTPTTLIRPLLGVTREELRDYLKELEQPWVEDETNDDVTRVRARLRQNLTPELHAIARQLPERLAALTDHARDVSALLRKLARPHALPLPRDAARRLNRAVLTEVLRSALLDAGEPGDRCTGKALRPLVRAIRDERGGSRRFAFSRHEFFVTADAVSLVEKSQEG